MISNKISMLKDTKIMTEKRLNTRTMRTDIIPLKSTFYSRKSLICLPYSRPFSTSRILAAPNDKRPLDEETESSRKRQMREVEVLQGKLDENKAQTAEIGNFIHEEISPGSLMSRVRNEREDDARASASNGRERAIIDYVCDDSNNKLRPLDAIINNSEVGSMMHAKASSDKYFLYDETIKQLSKYINSNFKGVTSQTANLSHPWSPEIEETRIEISAVSSTLSGLYKERKKLEKDLNLSLLDGKEEGGSDNGKEESGPSRSRPLESGSSNSVPSSSTNPSVNSTPSNSGSLLDDYADPSQSMPDHFGENSD